MTMIEPPVIRTEKRYRSRPVVIEAVLWQGDPAVFDAWKKQDGSVNLSLDEPLGQGTGSITVFTLNGGVPVKRGEWVIKGLKGELYPCDPEVFAEKYEEVEVELRPSREAIRSFFAGEADDVTAGEFARQHPLEPHVVQDSPFVDEKSREWASRAVTAAAAAHTAGFPFICVECLRGVDRYGKGDHTEACPNAGTVLEVPGPPHCRNCGHELWQIVHEGRNVSGCANPRCVLHSVMPRPADGSQPVRV